MSDKEFFSIPFMRIHRDDMVSLYEGRDDFEAITEKIYSLTDEQMRNIATRMTDSMLEQFYVSLKDAYEQEVQQNE